MGYASQQGRARVSLRSPRAAGQCDRCGFLYSHSDLRWQFDYAGAGLINKRMLVCRRCEDLPQNQLRSFVIPADPVPIQNPRVPNYAEAASNTRVTSGQNTIDPTTGIPVQGGNVRITEDDDIRVTQQTGEPPGGRNQLPGTDPNVPGPTNVPPDNNSIPNTGPLQPPYPPYLPVLTTGGLLLEGTLSDFFVVENGSGYLIQE